MKINKGLNLMLKLNLALNITGKTSKVLHKIESIIGFITIYMMLFRLNQHSMEKNTPFLFMESFLKDIGPKNTYCSKIISDT